MARHRNKNKSNNQDYRGLGPKGFHSVDERIRWEICEALAQAPTVDPSDLEVSVHGGEVTLTGVIDDLVMMRVAEDIIQTVSNVKGIHNHMKLRNSENAAA